MHIQFDQDFCKYFVQENNKKCGQKCINKEVYCNIDYSSEILEKPKHPKYFAIIQPTKVMSEYLT